MVDNRRCGERSQGESTTILKEVVVHMLERRKCFKLVLWTWKDLRFSDEYMVSGQPKALR